MIPNFQSIQYNINNHQNNYQSQSSYTLNLHATPYVSSKPQKKTSTQNIPSTNNHQQSIRIKEVFVDNFIQEIKNISNYLPSYNYVGMDTEFPGVIEPCPVATQDFYYKYTKVNVDSLKLIQVGITLTDDKGQSPSSCSTWQFNLRFDNEKDKYHKESINMLANSGIDFEQIKTRGIPHLLFAEYLIVSGLVLNEKITWICFNGSSDFAYLLKYLINDTLPENESEFIDLINLYFPNLYDVKYLVNDNETYKGGLNKLAKELDVERSGEIHQAGSDSQVTSDVFFRLIRNNAITSQDLNDGKNIIYGIGNGNDPMETITYTKFEPNLDVSPLMQTLNIGIGYKNNNQINNNFQDKLYNNH